MEELEKRNRDLIQRLGKEQGQIEEQKKRFKVQLEDVSSEHSKKLNKMGFLLANQMKVRK